MSYLLPIYFPDMLWIQDLFYLKSGVVGYHFHQLRSSHINFVNNENNENDYHSFICISLRLNRWIIISTYNDESIELETSKLLVVKQSMKNTCNQFP